MYNLCGKGLRQVVIDILSVYDCELNIYNSSSSAKHSYPVINSTVNKCHVEMLYSRPS